MYRCQLCKKVSEPGQARLVHYINRKVWDGQIERMQIARELSVCIECKEGLEKGKSMSSLMALITQEPAPVVETKIMVPKKVKLDNKAITKQTFYEKKVRRTKS